MALLRSKTKDIVFRLLKKGEKEQEKKNLPFILLILLISVSEGTSRGSLFMSFPFFFFPHFVGDIFYFTIYS